MCIITHADGSCVGRFFSGVCVSVCLFLFFYTIFQKSMELGPSNLTQKCSTMSPGNPLILGSNGQRSRSRGTKNHCRRGSRRSCKCELLPVLYCDERFVDHHFIIIYLLEKIKNIQTSRSTKAKYAFTGVLIL